MEQEISVQAPLVYQKVASKINVQLSETWEF